MINVVKVKTLYDKLIKLYRIDQDIVLKPGMNFVGTTRFGVDLVQIHCPKREEYSEEKWAEMLKSLGFEEGKNNRFGFEPVLQHPAKDSDIKRYEQNIEQAERHTSLFKNKIEEYKLNMKLVGLHYTLNQERLVCSYTADERIDFRDFVKDIGSALKQRIEMFQISAREAMLQYDTCGSCGRQLCCSMGCFAFINDKKSYNNKSAKFLGVCGKTRCCTFFEE